MNPKEWFFLWFQIIDTMALHMPPEKLFQHIVSDLIHPSSNCCCLADLPGSIFQRLLTFLAFFFFFFWGHIKGLTIRFTHQHFILSTLDAHYSKMSCQWKSLSKERGSYMSCGPSRRMCWPHTHQVREKRRPFITFLTMHFYVCLLNSVFVRMLSSVLLPVCQSLSDSNEVVRSAGLFALGQLSEHLQVSKHKRIHGIVHIVLFPLLLAPLEQYNLGCHVCIFFACFCYVYENTVYMRIKQWRFLLSLMWASTVLIWCQCCWITFHPWVKLRLAMLRKPFMP